MNHNFLLPQIATISSYYLKCALSLGVPSENCRDPPWAQLDKGLGWPEHGGARGWNSHVHGDTSFVCHRNCKKGERWGPLGQREQWRWL